MWTVAVEKKLRFKSKSSESKLKKEREYARLFLFYHSTLIPVYPHWKKAKLVWFKISISFHSVVVVVVVVAFVVVVSNSNLSQDHEFP